jgi:acetoin utilization deacetylase AcuC-like enzyme
MKDRLSVFWHPAVLDHDTGHGVMEAAAVPDLGISEPHPESAERVRNIKTVLENGPLAPRIDWRDGRLATRAELEGFHDPAHLDRLESMNVEGGRPTGTTVFGKGSWTPILAAAGTTLEAMAHVVGGNGPAYALVRPPGHHAARDRVDGYCFVNNIGVAVEWARGNGIGKVAIVDWDVHHGNGTQAGFYDRPDVLTVSIHMDHGPWEGEYCHPETGGVEETGVGAGEGFNLNVPLPFGKGDKAYRAAFEETILPRVREYAPDLLVVAAGQDGNQFDPNGRMCLTMAGYHWMGGQLRDLSREICDGRLLAVQEGGYARTYTAYCTHAGLSGLIGAEIGLQDPLAFLPDA